VGRSLSKVDVEDVELATVGRAGLIFADKTLTDTEDRSIFAALGGRERDEHKIC